MSQGLRWNIDAENERDWETTACENLKSQARIALEKRNKIRERKKGRMNKYAGKRKNIPKSQVESRLTRSSPTSQRQGGRWVVVSGEKRVRNYNCIVGKDEHRIRRYNKKSASLFLQTAPGLTRAESSEDLVVVVGESWRLFWMRVATLAPVTCPASAFWSCWPCSAMHEFQHNWVFLHAELTFCRCRGPGSFFQAAIIITDLLFFLLLLSRSGQRDTSQRGELNDLDFLIGKTFLDVSSS